MLRTKKSVFGKGGNCSDFGANSQAKKCLKRQFADESGEKIPLNGGFSIQTGIETRHNRLNTAPGL
jgi:hypothetical protein